MNSSDQPDEKLVRVARGVLDTVEAVARSATEALKAAAPRDLGNLFGSPTNTMTVQRDTVTNNYLQGSFELRAQQDRTRREPVIAKVVVQWRDGPKQTLWITRGSATEFNAPEGERLTGYLSPLGRVAEIPVGDEGEVKIGGRVKAFVVLERAEFYPKTTDDGAWDATNANVQLPEARREPSLRRLLHRAHSAAVPVADILGALFADEQEKADELARTKRHVLARAELRDQRTLDRHQGEVFRLELDRQVLLLGPAGSGKTTTLIRRLAQKRNLQHVDEEEKDRLERLSLSGLKDWPNSWIMFSPTELLQAYLGTTFNRELVPAQPDRNLRTWDNERISLARGILGILRSAESGVFELDTTARFLKTEDSLALAQLHDAFVDYAEPALFRRVDDAFRELAACDDIALRSAVATLRRRVGAVEKVGVHEIAALMVNEDVLAPHRKRLKDEIDRAVSELGNLVLSRDKDLLDELVTALPKLTSSGSDSDEDDEEDEEDEFVPARATSPKTRAAQVLVRAIRVIARSTVEGRRSVGRAGNVFELLGTRAPSREELFPIGLKRRLRADLMAIGRAPQLYVLGLPRLFSRFRRQQFDKFYKPESAEALKDRHISPFEVDVLILAMLRASRRVREEGPGRVRTVGLPDWLDRIAQRQVLQVFVDEATDFSSVQLASMIELARPEFRSWFACGDFQQRVTAHGLKNPAEIEWINKRTGVDVAVKSIATGYRQSARLRALSVALETHREATAVDLTAADLENEPWPQMAQHLSKDDTALWVAERIREIEETVGSLPSIAVFVESDEHAFDLCRRVRPLLARSNVEIVDCPGGRILDSSQKVRVFDIQHIKGLEFEAVLFVGIDSLARRVPDLFDRFLYVGVTRAATFLGISSEGEAPQRLASLAEHFSAGTWAAQ